MPEQIKAKHINTRHAAKDKELGLFWQVLNPAIRYVKFLITLYSLSLIFRLERQKR